MDDAHLVLPLLTLGDPQRLTGGYLYHLRMAEAAPRHGARVVFRSFPDRPFPLPALTAPRLVRHVERLRADAVLVDSIVAAFAAPRLAARPPPAAVVGVLHQPAGGIDHSAARTRAQAPLDRLFYRRADLLLAASDHLAQQLAEQGVPRARITVVPPGRDVAGGAALDAAASGDLRRGRRAAFLCVANWVPRKGIVELLDAFASLPPAAATLHLAGDEEADRRYARRVRRRLEAPELGDRVVRHGRLSRARVGALYAAADAFVLPAFREPYGTVWGEAMAFGLPVVGWRAGNLPYLARDGREGLLVPPGDVRALAQALVTLAGDAALRVSLGAGAAARAASRPTWEQAAADFFAAIRETIAAGRRGYRPRAGRHA